MAAHGWLAPKSVYVASHNLPSNASPGTTAPQFDRLRLQTIANYWFSVEPDSLARTLHLGMIDNDLPPERELVR